MMLHFQTVTRTSFYPHDVVGQGLDHCYDCAAEVYIWKKYIAQRGSEEQKGAVNTTVAGLSQMLSAAIDPVRTLAL